MDGHEFRRQKKMELIKQATVELCNKYGTKKVTVDDIAKYANVSKVTIYNYFNSKEELISTVVDEIYNSAVEGTRNMIAAEGDFLEKVKIIIESKIKVSFSMLNGDFLDELFYNSNSKAYLSYKESIKKFYFDFYDEGKKQGYIDESIDNEAIFQFSEIFNAGLQKVFKNDRSFFSNPKSFSQLIDLYFYGMIKNSNAE